MCVWLSHSFGGDVRIGWVSGGGGMGECGAVGVGECGGGWVGGVWVGRWEG